MDIVKAGQVVVLMLSPTLLAGAALYLPRAARAVRRLVEVEDGRLEPVHPPIEQLAADLRRLFRCHEMFKQSPWLAKRAQHLLALESAITDCATEAALALGVPCPDRPARGPLAKAELRALLSALASAGLVVGPPTALLAPDGSL